MKKIITSMSYVILLMTLTGCYVQYPKLHTKSTPLSFYPSHPTLKEPLLIFHGQPIPQKPYVELTQITSSCYENQPDDLLVNNLKAKAKNMGIHAIILSPKNHYTTSYYDETSLSYYHHKEYTGTGIIFPDEIDSVSILKAIYYVSNNDTVFEQQTDLWGNITSYKGDSNLYYFDYYNSLNHLFYETENWWYRDQGFQNTRKLYDQDTNLLKKVRIYEKGTYKQYATVTHYDLKNNQTNDTLTIHYSGNSISQKLLNSETVGMVQEDFYYHADGNINYREYPFKQNNSKVKVYYEYYPMKTIKEALFKQAIFPSKTLN